MRHRIQRQQFLLTLPPAVDAFRAQQAAGRFFHEVLLPMLERIFDELSGGDEVLHLDSCSIDLGVLDLKSLFAIVADETIYRLLRDEVKRMIEQELAARPHLRRSGRIKAWDTWRYYMENGYLPWNGDPSDQEGLQQVLAHLAVDYEAISWLRRAIQPETRILTRVVAQHEDEFLTQLVTVLTASRHPELNTVIREVIHLFRLLDQRYHESTTPGYRPKGTGAKAAKSPAAASPTVTPALAKNLNRWAQQIASYHQTPDPQQRAMLWQQLLAAATAKAAATKAAGRPASTAPTETAALAKSLSRWAHRMAPFRQAPEQQQRAILWQQLLTAAARRPADFVSQGAPGILLHDIEEEPALLDTLLEESSNRTEPQTRSWLQTARNRSKSRKPTTEPRPDDHSDKLRTATSIQDRGPAPAKPPEQPASGTSPAQLSAGQPSNAPHPAEEPDVATPPPAIPGIPAKARTTNLPAGHQTDTGAAAETEGIYVSLAGLVLVHPFLATLFHRTGYWDGAGFKDQEARQQAVLLAYYLATGDQYAPEYALAFPKILCGFPLELPLPAAWELPPEALAEAEVLLDNVLSRWEKVGNTSVSGLRQGFLQRGGKLTNKDGKRTLQLETSGIDVLLDYLPWNLSLVRLPWWKQILYVEWR
jgi:hypothetical protein